MIRKLMIAIGFTCMFSGIHAETISTEKDLTPDNVKKVLEAAGSEVDEARVKALIAALEDVDIEEAMEKTA